MTPGYSPVILEHFRRPRRAGALGEPRVLAEARNPPCGDRVRVELRVARDARGAPHVVAARFHAEACAVCVAAASLLLEQVEGAPLALLEALDGDAVRALLEAELPPPRRRCATLALEAAHDAARRWREEGDVP